MSSRGTVNPVPKGTGYYIAIRLDTRERDRCQLKRAGFKNKKEAERALAAIEALLRLASDDDQLQRQIGSMIVERSRHGRTLPSEDEVRRRPGAGLDPLSPGMTLGDWLDEWLASNRAIRKSTHDSYRAQIEHWLKPVIGEVLLTRVRPSHITDVIDWIALRNEQIITARANGTPVPDDPRDKRTYLRVVGPASANLAVTVLSMALKKAESDGLIVRNPRRSVKLARPKKRHVRTWDPAQVTRFIEATADDRLGVLFRLILMRGLRRGEVCGLKWTDVADDGRALTINRTMYANGTTGDPKTDDSHRVVSLDAETADLLRRHRRAQLEERMIAGPAWQNHGWIFSRPDGSHVPPQWLLTRFRDLAIAAGLPPIGLHEGRHTAATLGLEAGIPLKVVSDQLGHVHARAPCRARRGGRAHPATAVPDRRRGRGGRPLNPDAMIILSCSDTDQRTRIKAYRRERRP